jgi:hypothetical protein
MNNDYSILVLCNQYLWLIDGQRPNIDAKLEKQSWSLPVAIIYSNSLRPDPMAHPNALSSMGACYFHI